MVWLIAIVSIIVVLQILYIGLVRKDVENGFLSQDMKLNRFGTTLGELRRKTDTTSSNTDHLHDRVRRLENELKAVQFLCTKLMAEKQEKEDEKQIF